MARNCHLEVGWVDYGSNAGGERWFQSELVLGRKELKWQFLRLLGKANL